MSEITKLIARLRAYRPIYASDGIVQVHDVVLKAAADTIERLVKEREAPPPQRMEG